MHDKQLTASTIHPSQRTSENYAMFRVYHVSPSRNEDDQAKQYYTGKRALVVGSGPAGSIAASFLAKQGFYVDVYEKRKDPIEFETVPDRSILLILSRETANVIKKAGIELPSHDDGYVNGIHRFLGRPHNLVLAKDTVTGASFFTTNGEVSFKGDKNGRFLAERHDLAKHLMDSVRSKTPKITFHFEHSCDGANLSKQEVQFRDKDNNTIKQDYDLLVGADGVNSEVRKAMQEQINSFKVYTTPQSVFYKSYRDIIVDMDMVPNKYKILFEPGYPSFCVPARRKMDMEGLRAILVGRVANGMLSCSFSGTKTGFDSIKSQEKEYLNAVLPEDFPKEWIDEAVSALVDSPMQKLPSIIEVSSLIGPNVVLIGDAGHSVSPTIGVGCNMAIQDGQALDDALQSAEGDINEALERFNDVRRKQVKKCQQLEKFAVAANGYQKGVNPLLFLLARMHTVFHFIGNKYLPQLITEPVVLRFSKQEVTAKEALQILQLELASLLVVLAVIVLVSFEAVVGV